MDVFLGPFHPHLENALAGEIRTEREKDLLSPLLVLVPSDALRRRIKMLLATEHGFRLLNFQVHTFFQLSCILLEEFRDFPATPLRDDTFMEEALRRVMAMQQSPVSFASMMENEGTCAALWQSLRDLKDGLVDPEAALEALDEGYFAQRDEPGLRELFTVYRDVRAHFPEWGAHDYGDLDARVEPLVGSAHYLARFSHIYYYGFYDLTQSQLELFRSVGRNFPVTLFYPLIPGHPGWSFAEGFYDRHLRGLASAGKVVDLTSEHPRQSGVSMRGIFADDRRELRKVAQDRGPGAAGKPARWTFDCRIVSCSGTRDEVLFAAKETLRLVEDEGFDFSQIGVVARVLDPYVSAVKELFRDHGIPFHTTAHEPLMRFNLVKALLLLVDLRVQNFRRAQVIDLLASPYFSVPRSATIAGVEPRPEVWDVLTRVLRITRGLGEWNRLVRYVDAGIRLGLVDEAEGKPLAVPPEQVRMLLATVRSLHDRLTGLPSEGSWSELSGRWLEIAHEFIRMGGDAGGAPGAVQQVIEEIFERTAALEAVSARTSLAYFTRSLRKQLARASVPAAEEIGPGVHCLDAMSARGTPFRALFVLGLNEGVFPRTIREDPFLRDRARRVLDADLGCKVSEKLAAYEEEKLLFSLLAGSAREHLYLSYQRSDAAGRGLAPSWYVGEVQRALSCAGTDAEVVSIPRGVRGKERVRPFDDRMWLLPSELAVSHMLRSEDPRALIPLTGALPEMYERGVETIRALEHGGEAADRLDGLTGPLPELWQQLTTRGISPTALETYVRCPFQYFARYALRLERLEQPEALPALEPLEMGKICHEVLRRFYEEAGVRCDSAKPEEWRPLFDRALAGVLADYEREWPTGYPLEWQVAKQDLEDVLLRTVHADLERLAGSHFRPVACERELRTHFGGDWPGEVAGMPVYGRLDRIDHDALNRRLRVVDYKFKRSRSPQTNEKDLVRSAVRGARLQPPVYTLLGAEYARAQRLGIEAVDAVFYYIAPRWDDGPLVIQDFPWQVWAESGGAGIRRTIAGILNGIRAGEFFILPGDYCDYCEVSEICRKGHAPSLARANRRPRAQAIARMRRGDR